MHIPARQPVPSLAATDTLLKFTAIKTSSKPSLAFKSVGLVRSNDGVGSGGGGTESLNQATPSFSLF